MTTRMSGETITLLHPFRLSGMDDVLPPGRYLVETEEERLEGVSFPAYRRLSTVIHLAGRPHSSETARIVTVDPAELAAIRDNDAQMEKAAPTLADGANSGLGTENVERGIPNRRQEALASHVAWRRQF